MIRRLFAILALLSCAYACPVNAQTGADNSSGKIVVGTMRVPPFVLKGDDGRWSGLSIELWQQIAADMKISFKFREYDYDLPGLLTAVEQREIDVALAAIPVTPEGEMRFDFTHPYFAAGLGIAVRPERKWA